MDWQNVLRGNGHRQQDQQQQHRQHAGTGFAAAVDQPQGAIGQRMGQAGFGNGHRKGAQQRIAQRHIGALAQPALKGFQGRFQTQPPQQTAHYSANDQCHDHMHPAQAQAQHYCHGSHYCVHYRFPVRSESHRPATPTCRRARTLPHRSASRKRLDPSCKRQAASFKLQASSFKLNQTGLRAGSWKLEAGRQSQSQSQKHDVK